MTGAAEGANTTLDIVTDLRYTVVVLSNYDPPSGGRIDRKLRTLVTRGPQAVRSSDQDNLKDTRRGRPGGPPAARQPPANSRYAP